MKKSKILTVVLAVISLTMYALNCTDADIASANLSKQADMFQLNRRIVFYNGITGEYMLVIKGRCSVSSENGRLSVTCKTGPTEYKKHYLGLSHNVTYFSEQLDASSVNVYQYEVVWKPSVILPKVQIK